MPHINKHPEGTQVQKTKSEYLEIELGLGSASWPGFRREGSEQMCGIRSSGKMNEQI